MAKKIKPDIPENGVNLYLSQLLQGARMRMIEPTDSANSTLERHIRDYAVPIIIPTHPDAANGLPSKSGHFYNGNRFQSIFKNGVYRLRLDLSCNKLEMEILIDDLLFLSLPNVYSEFGDNLQLALKRGGYKEIIGAYPLKDRVVILEGDVYAELMEKITKMKHNNQFVARLQPIENIAENSPQ